MRIVHEYSSVDNFQFWGGAVDVFDAVEHHEKRKEICSIIEQVMGEDEEDWTATQLNDFVWFELEKFLWSHYQIDLFGEYTQDEDDEEEDDEETDLFRITVYQEDGEEAYIDTFCLSTEMNGESVPDTLKRLALKSVGKSKCNGDVSVTIVPINEEDEVCGDEVLSIGFEVSDGQIKEK